MIKQVLVSLAIVVVAIGGFVLFVPQSSELLARLGIDLPETAAPSPAGDRPPGTAPLAGPQRGQGGGANRALVVVTSPVTQGTINDRLTAIGEGAAVQSVTVLAPAAGTLTELAVRPGDTVTRGAVIGRLDDDAQQIAYERAEVAERDAEAALARTEELAGGNSATTVQLEAARLAATNAELATRAARLDLDRRTITAPITGTVGLFQASPGNQVTAQSVVTTIEDTSALVLAFYVPERYAPSLTPGLAVSATAVALPGLEISGEVTAIDNRVDPASRTLKVEARVDNPDGRLRPGMSFSVTMSFAGESFAAVDPLAVQWSSDGAYVWRYAEGKVSRVAVTIIQRNSDGILVDGDLSPGDQVVTQGVQQLADGATVRLLDEAVAANAGGASPRPEGQR